MKRVLYILSLALLVGGGFFLVSRNEKGLIQFPFRLRETTSAENVSFSKETRLSQSTGGLEEHAVENEKTERGNESYPHLGEREKEIHNQAHKERSHERTQLEEESKEGKDFNTHGQKGRVLFPSQKGIHFAAFPDFGGSEDRVEARRIYDFEKLAGRKLYWVYFSQNWGKEGGMDYPYTAIARIRSTGAIPFVRFMPWTKGEEGCADQSFSLEKIVRGDFDNQLRKWARAAKRDGKQIFIDFAVEPNGDWFPWSGVCHGNNPKLWRDAYRHIIEVFWREGVKNVYWFFHPDIHSVPQDGWNTPSAYYPGDEYIDAIGVSIYGALTPEDDWEMFSSLLREGANSIKSISKRKPFVLLEFGVTDFHPRGSKSEWVHDAFRTITQKRFLPFSAISYWHENWEENDGVFATLRIDSSPEALQAFREELEKPFFVEKKVELPQQKKKEQERWYHPKPGTSWQWQLSGKLNTSYDVDLYDIDLFETPKEVIEKLHRDGRKVICYINAGAYEPYRPDAGRFPKSALGKKMEGWEDERWLDIAHYESFADIMRARLDLAKEKGCDGVEPDNIDGYTNETGFPLTPEDQIRYNRWFAREAHKRGLAIALKNDLDQVLQLVDDFDFALNEQCFEYDECEKLLPFIRKGKAVLGVEYELDLEDFCPQAEKYHFSWLKMDWDLDGGREACK